MKVRAILLFMFLIASLTVSCANPATSPTTSPSMPTTSIQPGDAVGDVTFEIAKDETAEPSIFNPCSPFITDTDPSIIVRTCSVPQIPYLFIGYGDIAGSTEDFRILSGTTRRGNYILMETLSTWPHSVTLILLLEHSYFVHGK